MIVLYTYCYKQQFKNLKRRQLQQQKAANNSSMPLARPSQPQVQPAPGRNDTPAFLGQLQAWAASTIVKELRDLEAEFKQLLFLPKPEPSQEFLKNSTLNRYTNIVCLESSRAKLQNGRYIHANWINGSNGERRVTCTQGPLPNTVDDFWSLVMQEKIDAIVMLCETIESDRPKCHQYWPEDATTMTTSADGNLTINYVNQERPDPHLIKTRLQVTSANPKNQLVVRHFHWRQWPDQGVPVNHLAALRLLNFLDQKATRIIVHCSAGIGRTGTIVAIYLAQNTMRAGKTLDLHELVSRLRQQRAGAVQTIDQYLYIYSVLLRYAKNKAERGHIQLDMEATERLVQAIAKRIGGK